MFDLDAITRRAREAKEKSLADLHQSLEDLEKRTEKLATEPEQPDEPAAAAEPSTAPQVEILQSNHHRVVRFEGQLPHSLAVGVDGAYLAGSRYAADVFNDEGLLGYHGVITLMERLERRLDGPADLQKMIHEYGLVV